MKWNNCSHSPIETECGGLMWKLSAFCRNGDLYVRALLFSFIRFQKLRSWKLTQAFVHCMHGVKAREWACE